MQADIRPLEERVIVPKALNLFSVPLIVGAIHKGCVARSSTSKCKLWLLGQQSTKPHFSLAGNAIISGMRHTTCSAHKKELLCLHANEYVIISACWGRQNGEGLFTACIM